MALHTAERALDEELDAIADKYQVEGNGGSTHFISIPLAKELGTEVAKMNGVNGHAVLRPVPPQEADGLVRETHSGAYAARMVWLENGLLINPVVAAAANVRGRPYTGASITIYRTS